MLRRHTPGSRRTFLATAARFSTTALTSGFAVPALLASDRGRSAGLLKPGDKFNESKPFSDQLTGRPSRQLTTQRRYNQQPTYHLNACFSADSRHLVLATQTDDGGSAILRAEVESGELAVVACLAPGAGRRPFSGNNIAIVQAGNRVAANTGGLRLYDLDTLDERILIPEKEGQRFGHPSGSIDGKKIYLPRYGQPQQVEGATVSPVTHLEVDIDSGRVREIHTETRAQCNHVVPCPSDGELLLIDRDWPPKFSHGGDDGRTSRVWLLNVTSGHLTEIRPRNPNRFQIHSNWSYRGEYVYYHGTSRQAGEPSGGHYLGVADKQGEIVWEGHFPRFYYGHVSSHTRANAIITDGLFTADLITAVYWQDRDAAGVPRIEILAQHGSDWKLDQYSHPHCHVSPDGRWLSYNRSLDGRSDVCVVRIA